MLFHINFIRKKGENVRCKNAWWLSLCQWWPTKHLKFATTFDTKKKAEELAEKWLRSDVSFKAVEKESEEYEQNKNIRFS